MTQPLCLVARCRACGKIAAGSLIGPEASYSKQLGHIVQKSLRGFEVSVMAVNVPAVSGCGCTDDERANGSIVQNRAFGCVQNTIRLRSASYFDLLAPGPEQFTVRDIAGALAKICRFGGQCPRFYSVAEHSVHCYQQAIADGHPVAVQAAVLFHDSPEAFCGDVVKPLKLLLPEYAAIESRVEGAIAKALGIDFAAHANIIHEIDHAMLIAERKAMFSADNVKWFGEDEVRQLNPTFHFWDPTDAEAAFWHVALTVEGSR